MKGLELAERYFYEAGLEAFRKLQEAYPQLQGKLAAGLVGQGSECLGFDDLYSADHDYGPSFCIWLSRDVYEQYGALAAEVYEALPASFLGYEGRRVSAHGGGRVGVLCLEDFYYGLIGRERAPETDLEWMWTPESRLSMAANGKVFLDEAGTFTQIREKLLAFYPEDVRRKKIAARAAAMAQSGQYNYARLMRRGEWTGAALAEAEFIKSACSMVHLLNRKYTPFYKWMHRSLQEMERVPEAYGLLEQLSGCGNTRECWADLREETLTYGLNLKDPRVVVMETLSQLVIKELHRQGLSHVESPYLDDHTGAIMAGIRNPQIRSLQILEG